MIRLVCLALVVIAAANAADIPGLLTAARSAERRGDLDTAEDAFNAAFELALEKHSKQLSAVAVELGAFQLHRRAVEKAEIVLRRALDAEDNAHESPLLEIPVLEELESVYQQKRSYLDVVPVQTRLVKAWETTAGQDSVVVANNLFHLGMSEELAGQLEEAEQAMKRVVQILEKHYGTDSPAVGYALDRLATLETRLGKTDEAAETRKRESATRQAAAFPGAVRVGRGVSAPRPTYKPEPKYSEMARKKRIQGTVLLSLVIDKNGEPKDITVLLPLGDGLDDQAVAAVSTWRFQPGMKDGQPAPVTASIEVNFRLL